MSLVAYYWHFGVDHPMVACCYVVSLLCVVFTVFNIVKTIKALRSIRAMLKNHAEPRS